MTKRSIGTPEAIDLLVRKLNVQRRRVSYGGLKDKHALTKQFVTIEQGPRKPFREQGVELEFLGYAPRAFGPHDIAGNRFSIVMRDMSEESVAHAVAALDGVARDGLPNYFDDQRFGSVGESGEFIAAPWCKGDYERALWLATADPSPDDRADDRREKQILRDHWGRWPECKAALPRSTRRSLVTYLVDHPHGFRDAFALIKADLRGLYLSAFQSHLWNQILARFLAEKLPGRTEDVPLKLGPHPFPKPGADPLPEDIAQAMLPLPSARIRHEVGAWEPLMTAVVAQYGLELRELRVKYPRDSFFSKGERAAMIRVDHVAHSSGADELYPRRQKLQLAFDLPRGSYATILVKRLTTGE
jgi:tRNA pseudouridine13 synthase